MRWQYSLSLFFLIFSSTLFFGLAIFHTDTKAYYQGGNIENSPTIGYSWIWYHFEHWGTCLGLNLVATGMFFYGLILDIRESNWKLSNYIKIEITENEEP